MTHSPLHDHHVSSGASFIETAGWTMPRHYGDVAAEHRAVRSAAGVIDLSHRGKLQMTGKDRASFLHRMVTNEINALQPGDGTYAAMLTSQGKMLADMIVYAQPDAFLLDTEPGMSQTLYQVLDRYLLIDDVKMVDVTDQFGLIALHGPRSTDVLNALIGPVPGLNVSQHTSCECQGAPLLIARTNRTGELGYDLYVPIGHTSALWAALIERGGPFGVRPVGLDALDVLRVEVGIPRYGAEMDDRIIPVEAGITERAVSFTKGCYIGQETVAMITYRGRPNKLLVGLRIEGETVPADREKILKDEQEVGWITSGVRSLSLGGIIALGYVKRNYTEPGSHLTVAAGGQPVAAEVVALPFYESRG